MKIDIRRLIPTKENVFEEEISLDEEKFHLQLPLLEVQKLTAKAVVHRYSDFVNLVLRVEADVVLQCSYTLKPFPSHLCEEDEINFSSYEEDDGGDMQYYKGNVIDLDEYIYNLLSAAVPTSPRAPGAKLPSSGNGFRVLSDQEYQHEKEESTDPRFDALKDIEID